jgi:hypothetical protein
MLLACFVLCFPRGITCHYDPEVQFLEVGVTQPDGNRVWKVYGPDGDAGYGGWQGIGGLEALVVESTGTATPVLGDFFGHGVAVSSGLPKALGWQPLDAAANSPGSTRRCRFNDPMTAAAASPQREPRGSPESGLFL